MGNAGAPVWGLGWALGHAGRTKGEGGRGMRNTWLLNPHLNGEYERGRPDVLRRRHAPFSPPYMHSEANIALAMHANTTLGPDYSSLGGAIGDHVASF